jgi:hypothetical protein
VVELLEATNGSGDTRLGGKLLGGDGLTNELSAGGEGQIVTGGGESWGVSSSIPEERE